MSVAKRMPVATVFLFTLSVCSTNAGAGRLGLDIDPPGHEEFPENHSPSGQITWFAEQDLAIPNSPYEVHLTFWFEIEFVEPDNIPINPTLSDLTLLNWPAGYPNSVTWNFLYLPSNPGGPVNDWFWFAGIVLSPEDTRPTFQAGQGIATATWLTGGDDVDHQPDDGYFKLTSRGFVVLANPEDNLFLDTVSATKTFNPEPAPEPTTLMLSVLGAIALYWAARTSGRKAGNQPLFAPERRMPK